MVALNNSATQYIGSDMYAAVTPWAALTVDAAGRLIRPLTAPAVGSERVYVATTPGTTGAVEPVWTFTKGAIQPTDGTVVWQECTGQPGVNGDITNCPVWGATLTTVQGQIIYDPVTTSLQIVSSAGGTTKSGAPPAFSATAGVTTTDNTVTWTSLGLASTFAPFAAPHARVLNADAATWQTIVGNNNNWISNGHAETAAQTTQPAGGNGTAAKPNRYICVPNNVAPPVAGSFTNGAVISTTGAFNCAPKGYGYWKGVKFSAAGGGANAANMTVAMNALFLDDCELNLATTAAQSIILTTNTSNDAFIDMNNTRITFGATTQKVNLSSASASCKIQMRGGSIAATGSVPTTVFSQGGWAETKIRDVDLSACNSILFAAGTTAGGSLRLENCALHASATMPSTNGTDTGVARFFMHNCDSAAHSYRFYERDYLAAIQSETTIVNTAGASDGTTNWSVNIGTSSNATFYNPYVSEYLPIGEWNDNNGASKTASVEIAGANNLTNADIWLELEYAASALNPLGAVVNSRASDILTTPVAVPASAAAWGGAPAFKQTLQVTFTPQMKGPVRARVYVAKPSITVFIDPLVTIV